MKHLRLVCLFGAVALVSTTAITASETKEPVTATTVSSVVLRPQAPAETGAPAEDDPCAPQPIAPNSMSPTWDIQAATVQCGTLETDNLLGWQGMGHGAAQTSITSIAKYGVTPRLEFRWSFPGRILQTGGGSPHVMGAVDQWLGVLYHFHDQSRRTPDLALDYAIKFPTANPGKGFGSGYVDHVLTFVASRDIQAYHFDFNTVGTIAGAPDAHDGAAQFGFAVSRNYPRSVMVTVESFGGAQPGTSDRYAGAFLGGSWGIRPWLALNGGYIRTFTAGVPRHQLLAGFIYTMRPAFPWRIPRFGYATKR